MTQIKEPATSPCASCPYRRDVPSGVWEAHEYEKLSEYDKPTAEQPPQVFLCHQGTGRLCAGWAGCHDMNENLGLRIALSMGLLDSDVYRAAQDYESAVPLFATGEEAAEHGLADLEDPGDEACNLIAKLGRKQALKEARESDFSDQELNPRDDISFAEREQYGSEL